VTLFGWLEDDPECFEEVYIEIGSSQRCNIFKELDWT